MKLRKIQLIPLAIIILSFIVGIFFYPSMPEKIASHWNTKGLVNGYMPKILGLFIMPFISLVLFILFILLPWMDPLHKNIDKFRKHFDLFIIAVFLFLFYIYLLTIIWNLGYVFNITQFLAPGLGILFYFAGALIENAEPNWFIGIRNPWTMSSENVWKKTHNIGGKLFKISGVLALFAVVAPSLAIYFILVPVLFSTLYTFVYSYLEFSKEKGKNK